MISGNHTPAISVKFSPAHLTPSIRQTPIFDVSREDPEWIVSYSETILRMNTVGMWQRQRVRVLG